MDYEKIKALRDKMKSHGYEEGVDELEALIPELRESEDERIIKGLENFLWCIANGGMNEIGTMPSAEMCQKWIAYLEKQKEQKPAERFAESREKYQVEWSEEDRDRIAQYLHDRDGGMLWSKATEITRDILDMLRPQPKAGLTLFDENIIKPSVAFKAGAEWQKEHDAELIEIAYNDGITVGMTKQKEQMLKDAVEGEVGKDGILTLSNGEAVDLSPSLDKIAFGLQPSQKVRIVVLKEEED